MRFAADLDPPGETKRQALTLGIWLSFLALAVVLAVRFGTHAPASMEPGLSETASEEVDAEVRRSRSARLKVAALVGLLAPAAVTVLLSRRHRRGGSHARGITVEVTDRELRIWGRGYGTRVALAEATTEERLVDVYAGRLGSWRQIRLKIRSRHRTIELAARARPGDERTLAVEGGEGDCVELVRDDYDALKNEIALRRIPSPQQGAPVGPPPPAPDPKAG